MKFLSTQEAGEKWGLSKRRVAVLCAEGRIPENKNQREADWDWLLPKVLLRYTAAQFPFPVFLLSGLHFKLNFLSVKVN